MRLPYILNDLRLFDDLCHQLKLCRWKHCHVFEWLRRVFGLVSRFIGSSLLVTTNNCSTFKITVIITHKVFNSHLKSSHVFFNYELPVAVSYRELNWTPGVQRQSQSHIATDGQSVSKSWCRAPSGAHDQIFFTVWQLRSCFLWGALSDE
jgi:hypothetical protein